MLTMKELLNKALDQLKIAKVTINPRSLKKQISLFEIDDSQEVEFNGSKTPSSYHEKLYTFYLPCKQLVDQMMNESLHQANEIKREFDLYCFEIREFRQRYFPKEYVDVLLHRVELHKSSSKELINSENIKKNS
ncbi:MAG: hypothetical protein EBS09_06595 [Flavobacteriia bacterium]|nr:hypothetical protein [Flavobacteriia bacterium]